MRAKEERFRADLLEWGSEHVRQFAWRDPDRSLYEVFIAEFFLTQTPANNVAAQYPSFLDRFPSLQAIEEASEAELIEAIRPLGFYNLRADALKEIATHRNKLPDDAEELVTLPRVGRYIANATLCFAHDDPLPILDRNVKRIYNRVFQDEWPETTADQLQFAARLVPDDDPRLYNMALLDFGAAICQPEPRCPVCFATDYCDYYNSANAIS